MVQSSVDQVLKLTLLIIMRQILYRPTFCFATSLAMSDCWEHYEPPKLWLPL